MNTTTHETHLKSFLDTLKEKGYTQSTLLNYQRHLKEFLNQLKEENLPIKECTYNHLLQWIQALKAQHHTPANINRKLTTVRLFYKYLQQKQSPEELPILNPAIHLQLKGRKKQLPHDLLTKDQLENLYHHCPEHTQIEQRNKHIVSLYIFQALRPNEIELLETSHLNLKEGTITIPKNSVTNRRTLQLEARQILPLNEYITNMRPELLQQTHIPTEKLFFPFSTHKHIKGTLRKYLKQLRKTEPRLKDFPHIRTSVIALWAQGKNIREVQYKAGHYKLSTTEDYRKVNMKDLKEALNQYHPLR